MEFPNYRNVKTYGICAVLDDVDDSTDDIHHCFTCMIPSFVDKVQMVFRFGRAGEYLGLSMGAQPALENKMVDVAIQVDQGKLRTMTLSYSNECVYCINKNLIRELKNEMATAKQVMIKVGEKDGILPLDDFADAMADYKARVAKTRRSWLWPD